VIEAIAESMDWKLELYKRSSRRAQHAIVAAQRPASTPTVRVAAGRDQARFCGIHFFNRALHGAGSN